MPSEKSIVASNTDVAKNFLSDTQSTHLKRWWENGEALNIVACQIRGAIAIEQLGCEVGARGLDENGRAGLMTGEPGGSLPYWIDDNALWAVITPSGRLRYAAASKLASKASLSNGG